MSEEKQPQEEANQKDLHSVEETVQQPDKELQDEIADLAAEAEATELPTTEVIEAEIAQEKEDEAVVEPEVTVSKDAESVETKAKDAETPTAKEGDAENPTAKESDAEEKTAAANVHKEVPKKDYSSLNKEELLEELKSLLETEQVQNIKDHVEEINNAFNEQLDAEMGAAQEAFLAEGGNIIDFRYHSPIKKTFNEAYYDYRNKRAKFYQNRQKNLKANEELRNKLVEEVKALRDELGGAESVNTTYNKFKDIQERWHNAGNIPRDRYNLVWNNYYHHVDAFYELLHLNREFRDKHFKDNLLKKLQLIERAEELTQEQDINKAFKELQLLHRMWKEEIGPVSKEFSDEIWDKFSAATKKIHDARDQKQQEIEASWEGNLVIKQELISKIKAIAENPITSHNGVQNKIKEVEALREAFFKAGKVPTAVNEETWTAFKGAVRAFNHNKNDFYKSQKKEQYENLNKKKALIALANEHKDSDDFTATIDVMKKIQADWKKIGHVPRKDSDKVWKEFKASCNHFFDRLHASKKQANAGEDEAFAKKQALLETVKALKLEGEHKENLEIIKTHIATWKGIGRVPYAKKKIDEHFNKALDGLFQQLDIDKKEAEMIKYDNRMSSMAEEDNQRGLEKERFFITKKVQEIKAEINQLENNLGFFQHVPDDNPMVQEVHKNIAKHKDELELWQAKLRKVRAMFTN